MAVTEAMQRIDDAVKDEFDLQTRHQARQKEGSRRTVYEKSLRQVNQVAGVDAMEALTTWILQYIRRKEAFPSGRETRKRGAEICRNNGHAVPTGSWLGAD